MAPRFTSPPSSNDTRKLTMAERMYMKKCACECNCTLWHRFKDRCVLCRNGEHWIDLDTKLTEIQERIDNRS